MERATPAIDPGHFPIDVATAASSSTFSSSSTEKEVVGDRKPARYMPSTGSEELIKRA